MFMPSTKRRFFFGSTWRTVPVFPLSLPVITLTVSPFFTFIDMVSQHLRGERDDPHEVAVAQLARHRSEDARATRAAGGVDDHGGVLVEGDVGAVLAPELLLRAHDHGGHDLALLDVAVRDRLLDRRDDRVADAGVAALRPAADADAQDLAGAGVVGHAKSCLRLDQRERSSTSVSRQRLVRLIGRHSSTRTRSPSFASLRSSCACSVVDSRMIFLYMRCRRVTSTRTLIVLSAFDDVTTPWRTFGRPGPCSFGAGGGGGGASAR